MKENVLAHELVQVKEFFQKYGNKLLIAFVAVMLVVLVVTYYRGRSATRLTREQADLGRLTARRTARSDSRLDPADRRAGLEELARNARDPLTAARAAIALAEAHLRANLQAVVFGDAQAAGKDGEKARTFYQLVIDRHADRKPLVARARLGLGVLAENAGDVPAARQQYELARRVGARVPAEAEADRRLKLLDGWSRPLKFSMKPPPLPPPPPATAPTSAPAPASAPASAPAG